VELKDPLPKKIGLLADSHSELAAMETASRELQRRGATILVHLGDICDSLRLDLLEASVRIIRKHRIMAVKGNNDFLLENLLLGQPPENTSDSTELIAFLSELPIIIVWDKICFAHSLPFDHLRAFYEPIDIGTNQRAREIFQSTSHGVLFCGHSHQPVLFRCTGEKVSRKIISPSTPIFLDRNDRHIFVIGAVAEGECAIFDTEKWILERIRIPIPGP